MLQPERSAADFLEAGHYLEWTERFRSAKFDRFTLSGRMAKRDRANLGDIAERNPTDWARSRSVDASSRVHIVESQCWAQPHFHKPARLNDGKVQARKRVLYLPLGIAQGKRYARRPAKRNEKKPAHVSRPPGISD